jgi:opacity protein-like surface antigen
MRKAALLIAALAASVCAEAQAVKFFVGGSLSYTQFPQWAGVIDNYYKSQPTAKNSVTTQDTWFYGGRARGGVWLNDYLGFEGGVDYLGSLHGDTYVVMGNISGHGQYTFETFAAHAAALAGFNIDNNMLFAKVGLQRTRTSLSGTFIPATQRVFSDNALYGAGFSYQFPHHVAVRLEYEMFHHVKFVDYTDYTRTTAANLRVYSAGAEYTF